MSAESAGSGMDGLAQFLDAYDSHRVRDQIGFYERRVEEYERSWQQTSMVNEALLFLAGVCGAVAAIWSDQAKWLGLAAVVLAAVAGAVMSWAEIVGFAANSELYKAANMGLTNLRPKRPEADADDDEVQAYLTNVEEIVLGEVRTWSQKWAATEETSS